jgi:uncharacterized protein (DUF2235 family)
MNKRIVICCDGTWQNADQPYPTNVSKISELIAPADPNESHQKVFYDPGVGTGGGPLNRILGGFSGKGLEQTTEEAYLHLVHNYEEGDEIFLFGFSRGAYTARSTAGLIRNAGLLRPEHADKIREAYRLYRKRRGGADTPEALEFRRRYSREIEIKFMGVWDTVGALGIPLRGLRMLTMWKYRFHDVELSRIVQNSYHALAIDERRESFEPTLWKSKAKPGQQVEQVWFAGVHSDVGGGLPQAGLSDLALMWMKEKAEEHGLAFDALKLKEIRLDGFSTVHESRRGIYKLLPGRTRHLGQEAATEAVHPCVVERQRHGQPPYQPENLMEYLRRPEHSIAKVKDLACRPQ